MDFSVQRRRMKRDKKGSAMLAPVSRKNKETKQEHALKGPSAGRKTVTLSVFGQNFFVLFVTAPRGSTLYRVTCHFYGGGKMWPKKGRNIVTFPVSMVKRQRDLSLLNLFRISYRVVYGHMWVGSLPLESSLLS